MRKILFLLAVFTVTISSAQVDEIFKHNGEVVKGKVIRLAEYTVEFVYENEEAENIIGKYAVEKIIYGWENVVILEDKSYIAGLKKGDDVLGKTGLVNFQTGNTGDKKAEKKLKKAAAELGCSFILLTSDKTTVGSGSNRIGGSQAIKKGVAYKY